MKNGYELSCENISVNYFSSDEYVERLGGDHCHDRFEITYHLSASARYIVEGGEYRATPGSLILIPPMAYHRVEPDRTECAEGYTVHFTRSSLPEAVAEMLDLLSGDDESHGHFYYPELSSDAFVSVFDRFDMAERLGEKERLAYTQALLSEIVILLSATEGERAVVPEDELGARVARYLNANFKKNISLDRLARRFFVSKYHLCRAFKSYSGISVHAYVNQKRIIYAKGLIESGVTALGAAEKVGYGDYSAFYRAYVKIVGKSPTAE